MGVNSTSEWRVFFKSPKSQHKPQCLTVPPFPLALCPERCASSCGSANQSEELQLAFFYRLKQENQAAGAQGCSPVASVKTCVHTMDTYQGSPCSPPPPRKGQDNSRTSFVPMNLNLYGWQEAQSIKPWTLRCFWWKCTSAQELWQQWGHLHPIG